jgi:hypothetical protein
MTVYYYLVSFLVLLTIIYLVRAAILRKKNIPVELFFEALRNENSGHFEAAVVNYQTALSEAKKSWFHSNLENRINEKLRVLHTTIEYKNCFHLPGRTRASMYAV